MSRAYIPGILCALAHGASPNYANEEEASRTPILNAIQMVWLTKGFSNINIISTFHQLSIMIITIIGERAKRARHSQVCSIENRGYIIIIYSTCKFCSYNP